MASQSQDTPIKATCHCGAISVTAPRVPEFVNEDKCTICRRYGAVWAYYKPSEVKLETQPGADVRKYIWGDRDISFNFCGNCGCMVYWWPVEETTRAEEKMGLNTSNVDPEVLKYVERRIQYDALTATLRDPSTKHPEDPAKY